MKIGKVKSCASTGSSEYQGKTNHFYSISFEGDDNTYNIGTQNPDKVEGYFVVGKEVNYEETGKEDKRGNKKITIPKELPSAGSYTGSGGFKIDKPSFAISKGIEMSAIIAQCTPSVLEKMKLKDIVKKCSDFIIEYLESHEEEKE
jgi:hypothetical protein